MGNITLISPMLSVLKDISPSFFSWAAIEKLQEELRLEKKIFYALLLPPARICSANKSLPPIGRVAQQDRLKKAVRSASAALQSGLAYKSRSKKPLFLFLPITAGVVNYAFVAVVGVGFYCSPCMGEL